MIGVVISITGVVTLVIGIVLYLIGAIELLIDEFKEHIAWGLLGLFTQIGHLIFVLCCFDKCKRSLGHILLGIILMIIGGVVMLALHISY